jgi:hypothetical protein
MLIKSTKQKAELAPEGEFVGPLKNVPSKREGKNVVLEFEISHQGKVFSVGLEAPASLDKGPLRKSLEALNNADFTNQQVEQGIDPETFIGRKARLLVQHKKTSGGRVVAVVSTLLPLLAATPQASSPTTAQTPVGLNLSPSSRCANAVFPTPERPKRATVISAGAVLSLPPMSRRAFLPNAQHQRPSQAPLTNECTLSETVASRPLHGSR